MSTINHNDYENETAFTASSSLSYSSPSKSSWRTPKSKTPKGDRFIPNCDDLDISRFKLTKENSNPNESPSKLDYNNTIENSLFEGKSQSKILAFKSKVPMPKNSSNNSLHALYGHSKLGEDAAPKKSHRHIPSQPERVLDAPDMQDDYYLNLLDWSSSNILSVALGSGVYLWNATTSEITPLLNLEDGNKVTSVAWMKDSNYLAVGTDYSTVQLWNVDKKTRVREMKGHEARVGALSWNSHIVSSGSKDTSIINHDVRIHQNVVSTLRNHTSEVCGLKWSHDGLQLASGGNDNRLNIWDANNRDFNTPLFSLDRHVAAVKALAWCPFQQNLLASGGGTADRTIRFWNTTTGQCMNTIDTKSQVCSIMWSTHYKELVSSHGYSQNQLCVWKYPSMTKVAELTGHTSRVLQLAQSPDGETIVSAAGDETLRFWKVFEKENKATGSTVKKMKGGQSIMRMNMIR